MSKISFDEDPLSSRVTRIFLLLQIAGVVSVVALSLRQRSLLAITISSLTFFAFFAIILWLYARYRGLRIVREKRELEHLLRKFQKGIESEGAIIQTSTRAREHLFQSEKDELQRTLSVLQTDHIENGLAAASVQDAAIPGIGTKLKERLAGYGVVSAAQVTSKISEFPGFGEAKRLALMDWRNSVIGRLEGTKPASLSHEQLKTIRQKYQAALEKNDAAERKARSSKQLLEHELASFRPRLEQLAPINFPNYLSRSLAGHGGVATLIALLLVVTQAVSAFSATASAASSLLAFIPTKTPTATLTDIPADTATPSQTFTAVPTATQAATSTLPPSVTPAPLATITPQVGLEPSNTPLIPISGPGGGGDCDPAYPGVCIPPAPPDLDCGDITFRRFQVLPADPHYFDGDKDGIGCES